jgi:NAD-dependent SIR2 family protein deacetylase
LLTIASSALIAGEPLNCPKCEKGWVKPDIVFFGEGLPDRFHALTQEDFDKCDLCITMGTSLYVQPFASLPNFVSSSCKRVLINRERVGNFKFNDPTNTTDIFYKGNADDGCEEMALAFGFREEMVTAFANLKQKIMNNNVENSEPDK